MEAKTSVAAGNFDGLVSVVIPCFNAAQYLAGAVRSVLAQQTPQTEIIIVDDRSTDDSRDVARSLAEQFPQVHLREQSVNAGPAAARNLGLRHAVGRFVCFLDADDEYAPGFFARALAMFQTTPELAAVIANVELIDCHRAVHPLHMEVIVNSLPSNIILRKWVADLVGGFPEGPEFRGKAAGEDAIFRRAIRECFRVERIPERLFRYRVKRGGHFDYFFERSQVVDGDLVFLSQSEEEKNGELELAKLRYFKQAGQRIDAQRSPLPVPALVKGEEDTGFFFSTPRLLETVTTYDTLRARTAPIRGYLHPQEGFTLFLAARDGPGEGAIVEIGSFMGLSTCWLASGTRSIGREKVVAVDHFRGSPEHQENASHRVAEIVQTGTTLPAFIDNLQRCGVRECIEVRVGSSAEVGAAWQGPIRLLFIDGDHSYEAAQADIATWSRHVVAGGIMAFHDIGVWPGVTRAYQEFLAANSSWNEVCWVHSLRLVRRRGTRP